MLESTCSHIHKLARNNRQDDSTEYIKRLITQGYTHGIWNTHESHEVYDICDELNGVEFELQSLITDLKHNAPIFETSHPNCLCHLLCYSKEQDLEWIIIDWKGMSETGRYLDKGDKRQRSKDFYKLYDTYREKYTEIETNKYLTGTQSIPESGIYSFDVTMYDTEYTVNQEQKLNDSILDIILTKAQQYGIKINEARLIANDYVIDTDAMLSIYDFSKEDLMDITWTLQERREDLQGIISDLDKLQDFLVYTQDSINKLLIQYESGLQVQSTRKYINIIEGDGWWLVPSGEEYKLSNNESHFGLAVRLLYPGIKFKNEKKLESIPYLYESEPVQTLIEKGYIRVHESLQGNTLTFEMDDFEESLFRIENFLVNHLDLVNKVSSVWLMNSEDEIQFTYQDFIDNGMNLQKTINQSRRLTASRSDEGWGKAWWVEPNGQIHEVLDHHDDWAISNTGKSARELSDEGWIRVGDYTTEFYVDIDRKYLIQNLDRIKELIHALNTSSEKVMLEVGYKTYFFTMNELYEEGSLGVILRRSNKLPRELEALKKLSAPFHGKPEGELDPNIPEQFPYFYLAERQAYATYYSRGGKVFYFDESSLGNILDLTHLGIKELSAKELSQELRKYGVYIMQPDLKKIIVDFSEEPLWSWLRFDSKGYIRKCMKGYDGIKMIEDGTILGNQVVWAIFDVKKLLQTQKPVEKELVALKQLSGKQVGLLYHYTTLPSAVGIIESNSLLRSPDGIDPISPNDISFTRNKNFHNMGRSIQGLGVTFVIDGDKLSNNYKIKPHSDFQHIYKAPSNDESEERVKQDITNIKDYIVKVILDKNNEIRDRGYLNYPVADTTEKLIQLCKDNNIPLEIKKLGAKQVGTLYHFTSVNSCIDILEDNELRGNGSWISFTRNKDLLNFATNRGIGSEARITIDGDKLSNNYKIEPYNDFAPINVQGNPYNRDFKYHLPEIDENEERIKGKITNIIDYITGITVHQDPENIYLSKSEAKLVQLCTEKNIPVNYDIIRNKFYSVANKDFEVKVMQEYKDPFRREYEVKLSINGKEYWYEFDDEQGWNIFYKKHTYKKDGVTKWRNKGDMLQEIKQYQI